jgi:hypothetical protein
MCLQECWLHSLNLFAELQGSSADGVMRIYKDGLLRTSLKTFRRQICMLALIASSGARDTVMFW